MKYTIGMFDSGIGGLTILKEIKKILPNENILYYKDSSNNPYGSKSKKELIIIAQNIINYLINKGCKIIIIACNTMTTRCIKDLRKMYPNIIFIGTEPAIKLAYDNNSKNTLILATPVTIKSKRLKELCQKYHHNNQTIYLKSCNYLANAIENKDKILIKELLYNYLKPYLNKNIDSIILGCTHYPYIKKDILNYFPNTKIYDSSKGVAKQLKNILIINNLLNKNNKGIITIKDA